jgi:hypothetical protein
LWGHGQKFSSLLDAHIRLYNIGVYVQDEWPIPNIAANYGNADYDIRHNVTGDFVWDMPFKLGSKKLLSNLLANWTVSGRLFLRSGTPFSIIDSNLAGGFSPVVSGLPEICGGSAVNTPCFGSSQFVTPNA